MTESATVVDTPGGRLRSLGLTLHGSHLASGGRGWLWVLRLPERVDKARFEEPELVWSAEGSEVPSEATDLLWAVLAGQPLVPATALDLSAWRARRVDLDATSTLEEVLGASIADSAHQLLSQDLGLRISHDPEWVHQARVATRTLRSDLRTFRPVLDRTWVGELRAELKWLAAALGAVRDLDVLEARLHAAVARVPTPPDGEHPADEGAEALVARLRRRHGEARADLAALLASPRYAELLAALDGPARWAAEADPAAPARVVAGRLVRRPWRRLARAVGALGLAPADEELHGVRLRAKQLRFAATTVAPVVGPPAERLARQAKALQSVLGDHQDAVTSSAWLRTAVAEGASPEEAWFAGQAALLDAEDRQMARERWPSVWAALDRPSMRRWLR